MKKLLIIAKNEIITILSRPSFWLAALGVPLVAAAIFGVVGLVNKNASASQTVSQVFSGPQEMLPEGYVDLGGIIREIPASVPTGAFIAYPDEASAQAALAADKIAAFYIVPPDFVQSGKLTYIRPDFNPLSSSSTQASMFTWVLQVNLVGGDIMLASLSNGPMNVEEISLAPVAAPDENDPLAYWTPYAITLVFYMLIIGSSSLLLSNVSKEKENRIMEVLLTSVTPRQLLSGKIIGLGAVGLGQAVLWLGMSYLLLNRSGQIFNLASAVNLPVSFLIWGLVFFLLGYAVYASLMAGLGALAPNLREASQVTFVILIPLLIPLFFSSTVFMEAPNGMLATVLSLIPFCAPVAMMARLSAGGVAWWQPWLSALLLAVTAVLIVRAVARMFRAQALLSGQGFNVKLYLRALAGKI
jgi:ABC-2 type transport system permease protein